MRLSQAVGLNAAGINVARLAGPAIGGATLALFGATACFAPAVSFLALVLVLLRIPARPARRREGRHCRAAAVAGGGGAPILIEIGGVHGPRLADPELAPVVADRLDAGPEGSLLLGTRWAAACARRLAARATARRGLPRRRALPIATVSVLGRHGRRRFLALAVACSSMAFSGAFWIWMFAATNTAIQLRSPRALLGRMLGLYQLSVMADRHRLDGRRRRGRARGSRPPSPGAPRCSPRGAPGPAEPGRGDR